jgi:hypothetical protein
VLAAAATPQVSGGGARRDFGDKSGVTDSTGGREYRVLNNRFPPRRAGVVVERPADRNTLSTAGLSRPKVRETFGLDPVRGQETRAQQRRPTIRETFGLDLVRGRETRAQRALQQAALVDLLAEAIAADDSAALMRTHMRVARPHVR